MEIVRVLCCGISFTGCVWVRRFFWDFQESSQMDIGDYTGNCTYLFLMRDALKDIKNDFFHELTAIGYNQDSTCINEGKLLYESKTYLWIEWNCRR